MIQWVVLCIGYIQLLKLSTFLLNISKQERKQLIGQRLNEKHNNWGSLLLGLGVLFSVSGGLNTFLRTGKLFPGPHLYAGAAITVLWALAAALVPAMQKGNDTARTLHITFNTLNLLLFVSQVRIFRNTNFQELEIYLRVI